jgi:DNA-binding SARP family transcriptional activator
LSYQLDLFGGIALQGPDGPLTGRVMQRHPLALLSVLATSKSCMCSRDRVIGLLWSAQAEERARHNLSDTLYVIHKSLGDEAVTARGDLLRLESTHVRSDVCEFEAALAAGRLEDAVGLYCGPVLDGFHLTDAIEFDEWCEARRRFYASNCGQALEQLARQAESRGDFPAAIDWWQQRARHSPYNSAVARICVQALLTSGDPGDAVRFAQEHVQRLRDDLGVEPPEDLAGVAKGNPPFKAAPHEFDPPPMQHPLDPPPNDPPSPPAKWWQRFTQALRW